jgi:hypothetical protein
MSIPTFDPPRNAEFIYTEGPRLLTDTIPMHKGYDQVRPLLLRPVRLVRLAWNAASDEVREYILGFFAQLAGQRGPLWWTPYDSVPSPSAVEPTLGQVAGGALGARTCYVVFTWYDAAYGETKPSAQASLSVAANYYLTVTVPPLPSWVESWRVYAATTSGSECLQDTVSDGRIWTQSAAFSTGTATAPTANTLSPPAKWLLEGDIDCQRFRPNRWRIILQLSELIV